MSGFENQYELYDRIVEQIGEEDKFFIGLVSKLCEYLDSKQIFELYETSRKNLIDNFDHISENTISPKNRTDEGYVLSAVVLNAAKLVTNEKLKKYEKALLKAVDISDINNYVLETKFSQTNNPLFTRRAYNLRKKIDTIKDVNGDQSSETAYFERLYLKELKKSLPRLITRNEGAYEEALLLIDRGDYLSLEKFVKNHYLLHYSTEVHSSLFHTEIPEKPKDKEVDDEESQSLKVQEPKEIKDSSIIQTEVQKKEKIGMLEEHYSSDETALNTENILNTKNAFLDYLERNASDSNNYRQILSLAEAIKDVLYYQEMQEIDEDNWELTEAVLDFVCPEDQYNTIAGFFSNRYVKRYITPTTMERGELYVHALENSEEIKLMAEYLKNNFEDGEIKAFKKENIMEPVCAIMPYGCAKIINKAAAKVLA